MAWRARGAEQLKILDGEEIEYLSGGRTQERSARKGANRWMEDGEVKGLGVSVGRRAGLKCGGQAMGH